MAIRESFKAAAVAISLFVTFWAAGAERHDQRKPYRSSLERLASCHDPLPLVD